MNNNTKNERNLIKEFAFYLLFALVVSAIIFAGFFIAGFIEYYKETTETALSVLLNSTF